MELSPSQKAAWKLISEGHNVCVTGLAGSGKSTLLNERLRGKPATKITGSTGVAAINVTGVTLHSFMHYSPLYPFPGNGIGKARKYKAYIDFLEKLETLVIDEVSMVSAYLLEYLDKFLRGTRKVDKPFGGVQIVALGDFMQLPPVSKEDSVDDGRFCFQSPLWQEAKFKTALLTENFRQSDKHFADVLNKIRIGEVDDDVCEFLATRPKDSECPQIRLRPYNVEVDRINAEEFSKIEGSRKVFESTYSGNSKACKLLEKNTLAPDQLVLAIGAKVMLLKNLDFNLGLVNGSQGYVIGFDKDVVVVRFDNGEEAAIKPANWEAVCDVTSKYYDEEFKVWRESVVEEKGCKTQIPLRLAYALTVHKSQGLQFDSMEIDLSKMSNYGQAYVALSRCKNPDGLGIVRWSVDAIKAHPEALKFYQATTNQEEEEYVS